jgi:hypothetical protein
MILTCSPAYTSLLVGLATQHGRRKSHQADVFVRKAKTRAPQQRVIYMACPSTILHPLYGRGSVIASDVCYYVTIMNLRDPIINILPVLVHWREIQMYTEFLFR